MPLTVVAATGPGSAMLIKQKFHISTSHGQQVGSVGYTNCLGIVIHSPRDSTGCLTHVEAPGNATVYAAWCVSFVRHDQGDLGRFLYVEP